jgi:hypothetical protein
VRIRSASLLLLLLGVTACVAPLQQGAYCPWARQALAATASTAAAPAPVPPPVHQAWPLAFALFPAHPGRLDLSNYTDALADVEAIVTPYADCAPHPGIVARDFKLPLNATWTITAPPGSDVCWRQLSGAAPPGEAPATPSAPPPAKWNRAFTSAGRFVDAQL